MSSKRNSINARLKILYINYPCPTNLNTVPLISQAYLGTVAHRMGCEVYLIDANFYLRPYSINDILMTVNKIKPDIIGMTFFTHTALYGYDLVKKLKSVFRGCTYVSGGPHASILHEEILEHGFDIVCKGEGEEISANLIRYKSGELKLKDIDGISYKEDGEIIHQPSSQLIKDLDTLPDINYDLFDPLYFSEKNLKNEFGVFSSRGCPNKCTFCNSYGVFGTRYRYRSTENILNELELLNNKYKIKRLNFVDDYFTLNKDRLHKICEGIIKNRLDINWSAYSMAKPIPKDLLSLMKKAGCIHIAYGVENVYPKTLKLINKKVSNQQIEQTFQNHVGSGIGFKANIMVGFPWETKESVKANIQFILYNKLQGSTVRFNIPVLNPIPSTKIYNDHVQEFPKIKNSWLRRDINQLIISNYSKADLLKFNYFNLKPKVINEIYFLYFVAKIVPSYNFHALKAGTTIKSKLKFFSYPFKKMICSYSFMKIIFKIAFLFFPHFTKEKLLINW